MSKFEDGLKLFDECCGNKDNVISLSTIELDLSAKGNPRPAVRDVGAFYEDVVILAIRINTATVFKDHGAVHYQMDFVNKTVLD